MRIGLIGLGVMGCNLALNLRDAGHGAVVWDPWPQARDWRPEGIETADTLADLIAALDPPRALLLMIKAGDPVNALCDQLAGLLAPGDRLVDGGNSFYRDSEALHRKLSAARIGFLGLGISGGAEGARNGPAMMAGGDPTTWEALEPVLRGIAAEAGGQSCADYFGSGGAGHFVKMVHNGIEYAVMQAIAEACDLLGAAPGRRPEEIGGILAAWARGPLAGYLIEITAEILGTRDDLGGGPLISVISDRAGHKGTGGWCVAAGLDYGIPIPAIAEAVSLRQLSARSKLRAAMSQSRGASIGSAALGNSDIEAALTATVLTALSQGLQLIEAAGRENAWDVPPQRVAQVWRQGSILRMALLEQVTADSGAGDLLRGDLVSKSLEGWRRSVAVGLSHGLPIPVMAASLAYWNGLTTARLPTAMIQAQRDRFGAHGFERSDRPGTHHGPWNGAAS